MSGAPALAVRGVRSLAAELGPDAPDAGQGPDRSVAVLVLASATGATPEGTELLEQLGRSGVATLVVCGAAPAAHADLGSWLLAGADAVLPFGCDEHTLVAALRAMARWQPALTPDRRSELVDAARARREAQGAATERLARLSPREARVLQGLLAGHTAQEMADEDVLSVSTIRSQLRAVLRKLDVASPLAAVALAARLRWAPTDVGPVPVHDTAHPAEPATPDAVAPADHADKST